MSIFWKRMLVLVLALVCTSCGGGADVASGGGSGIGGTGISFVKGNVVSVNGQTNTGQAKALFASTGIFQGVMVSGGGKSSPLNQFGGFELANVTPSENLVLTFDVSGSGSAILPVGMIDPGQTAIITDIVINTNSGSASSSSITRRQTEVEDDDSDDLDSEDDEDDDSEDDGFGDDEDDEDSEDSDDDEDSNDPS